MTTNQMHDNACHDPATASYPLTHADDWTLFIFFSYWTYELLKVCAFLWFSIHKQAHDRHLLLVDNPGFSFYLLSPNFQPMKDYTAAEEFYSCLNRNTNVLREIKDMTNFICRRLWHIHHTALVYVIKWDENRHPQFSHIQLNWYTFFFSLYSSYSSILT